MKKQLIQHEILNADFHQIPVISYTNHMMQKLARKGEKKLFKIMQPCSWKDINRPSQSHIYGECDIKFNMHFNGGHFEVHFPF